MTFSVTHWDTLDDSLCLQCKGRFSFIVQMESVMCLHFSMQEEDILAHTHPK